jgi:hypothetical protein
MKKFLHLALACLCVSGPAASTGVAETAADLPKVVCASPQALAAARSRLAKGDADLQPALDQLLRDANDALDLRPRSVMDKNRVPPSGDKHDFISQAPYYWPDTNAPDGQYIHKDGQRNPEAGRGSDAGNLGRVCSASQTLALAYYFTGREKYAVKAAELIRVWFLNPATRMNPNLNYGQGIPGKVDGRPEGLISARGMVGLVDALGLLGPSPAWTAADQKAMTAWLEQYFRWLTTNPLALREGRATNNHGTFYDTQVAAIALFLGKTNQARELLLNDRTNRIASQIEPDGRQPRELRRTLSFDYSVFNLRALFVLASIGQNAGVDLWHYQTPDGRSIRQALKFLAAHANPETPWPYKQIHRPRRDELIGVLLQATAIYPQENFPAVLKEFPAQQVAANRTRLMFATGRTAGS